MRIIKCRNYDEISAIAAKFIFSQVTIKPNCVLGLATGSTPVGLYKELIKIYNKKLVDFKDVITFNLDEYIGLPKNDKNSYYTFMYENLFNHINIEDENIHIPDGNASDMEKYAEEYESLIDEHGGIDIQILGIGQNSHIGFNEPDRVFSKYTGIVNLTESTIKANSRFFDSIDDVPTKAISMGIGSIFKSKLIILMASGKEKAKAVYDMVKGPIDPKVPASILQLHLNVVVIVDDEAGQLI